MALPTNYEMIKNFPYLISKLEIKEAKADETAMAVCPECKGKLFFVLNEPKPYHRGKGKYRYRFVCAECGFNVLYWER
jgi:uncharacterized protein with PIN domain